jgi:hypothetical protein
MGKKRKKKEVTSVKSVALHLKPILAIFMGELVNNVRTFYAQESKNKELLKYLLLLNNNKEHSTQFFMRKH